MAGRVERSCGLFLRIAAALIILVQCHAQEVSHQRVVARIVDRYTITFAELEKHVRDLQYPYMYRKYPSEPFERALDDMIVEQLKRIDFFALGLNTCMESLPRMRRSIVEEMAIRYYRTQFFDKFVNEDSVRSVYKNLGREVVYQQIVVEKPRDASRKQRDSLISVLNAIRTRARQGEDWARLAAQYSHDFDSRYENALLRVDWKLSLSNDVRDAVFRLSVNAVRILDGGDAFHVVRVVRIDTKSVQPYEAVKEDIRKDLERRYADFSYERFEQAKKELIDETKVKWNSKTMTQLVQWSNIPGFYQTAYLDTLRDAIAHGRNAVILEYSKTRVDLREFLRLLTDVLTWGNYVKVDVDQVKKFVLEAVRTKMLADKASNLGLEKDVFTPESSSPVLRSGMLVLYDQHEIEEQIPPATEPALKAFYQANRDSLYYQLAKKNIYVVLHTGRSVIEGMKEKLHQNVPFERLAPEILVQTFIRKRDGVLAPLTRAEPPILAEAAFKLQLNEIAGPIAYDDQTTGKRYALIKCVGTRDEKQLTFDDVSKTITDDFAKYHRERLTLVVRERLKRKYNVTIDRDALQKLYTSIGIAPR